MPGIMFSTTYIPSSIPKPIPRPSRKDQQTDKVSYRVACPQLKISEWPLLDTRMQLKVEGGGSDQLGLEGEGG